MERFDEFIRERKYLHNVSPATLYWYRATFRAWEMYGGNTGGEKQWVVNMREKGKAIKSINQWICGMNAYWNWEGVGIKLKKLREEQKILATLSADGIKSIINFRPVGVNQHRAHLVALTILDTGLRASEVLGLTKKSVDLDNLVLKVLGKGNKHRLVPFSLELRKHLFIYTRGQIRCYIFGTKNNTKVSVRNLERDFQILGEKLGITGIRFSPHTLRHTFAVFYLRRGGNLEFLRRILGHTSLATTQKYLKSLGVEDLSAVHSSLSCLTKVG